MIVVCLFSAGERLRRFFAGDLALSALESELRATPPKHAFDWPLHRAPAGETSRSRNQRPQDHPRARRAGSRRTSRARGEGTNHAWRGGAMVLGDVASEARVSLARGRGEQLRPREAGLGAQEAMAALRSRRTEAAAADMLLAESGRDARRDEQATAARGEASRWRRRSAWDDRLVLALAARRAGPKARHQEAS